jgi:hypothetical protein
VLDLDARVHLQEVEAALLVDEELDGTRADVAHGARGLHGDAAHLLARLLVDRA